MGISVLMSVYEKEKSEYFEKALDSIINQTYKPDEIIIIKDGPITDSLEKVIHRAKEKFDHIIEYQFEQNVQLGRALAKGVELCSHELIARMDTDDIAVENRLEIQQKFMLEHPEVAVCGGWVEEFNDDETYRRIKKMPDDMEEIRKFARYRNPLNHMTVMARKEKILAYGNYQHFPLLEDYYLWCKMLANGERITNIQMVLAQARTNEGIYKRRGGWKYFKRYLDIRKEQRYLGMLSVGEYVIAILLSAVMTLLPTCIRRVMYRKILRK